MQSESVQIAGKSMGHSTPKSRLLRMADKWQLFRAHSSILGLLLFIVGACLAAPTRFAGAQDALPPPLVDVDQIIVKRLPLADGLPPRGAWAIIQDRQGFMWIGTNNGLARYDGNDFRIFREDPDNPNSLSSNSVFTLYEDGDGFIWIGTPGGANRFDPRTEQFTRYQNNPQNPYSLSSDFVRAIYQDSAGTIWIGTVGGGLNRLDPTTETFIRYQNDPNDPSSLSNNNIYSIYEDHLNNLWIPTYGGGLDLLDRETGTFTHYRHNPQDVESLSNDNVFAIYEDRENNLWIGTWGGGLELFDREQGTFIHYPSDPNDITTLSNPNVNDIVEDPAGNLWVATFNGLNRLERETGSFVRYPSGPADPNYPNRLGDSRIRQLFVDRDGQLWIATEGAGINVIDLYRQPFLRYRHDPANPNSLSAGIIRGLYYDHQGMVWVGTVGGGLNRFDLRTSQISHYVHDPDNGNSLVNNTVFSIAEDETGMLWIGTSNGVSKFDPESGIFVNYQHDPNNSNSLIDNSVVAVLVDRSNKLWFATWGGLDHFDSETETFTHYRHDSTNPASISGDVLVNLYQDNAGKIWVTTEGYGTDRFDETTGTFEHFKYNPDDPNTISDNVIASIYEDQRGIFWFGTWASGLDRYDPATNQFTNYDTRNGMPDNQVFCILPDEQGNLWLGHAAFWSKFDVQTETFASYNEAHGLPRGGSAFASCAGAPSGQLFYGSAEGLVTFFPNDITKNLSVPPVVISDVQLNHAPVSIGTDEPLQQSITYADSLELPPETDTLSLTFAALNFRAPSMSHYRYMLSGFDNNWTMEDSSKRFATYTNLFPGDYEFRVTASNEDGVWNDTGRTLRITVLPQWWQTTWFRAAAVLAGISALLVVYRLRTLSLRAQNRKLEQKVIQRTSELSTLLDVSQNVGSTLELQPLLELILEQLVSVIDYAGASIHTFDGERLSLQAFKQRMTNDDLHSVEENRFPAFNPLLSRVAITRSLVYIPDLLTDDQGLTGKSSIIRPADTTEATPRSWLAIPIVYKETMIGVLAVAHGEPNAFSANSQRLVQTFANHIAYAIANAQYHERAQREVVAAERQYITREMHDSLSQTLFAANATVLSLSQVVDKNNQAAQGDVTNLIDLINQAQSETRALLTELRTQDVPATLYDSLNQLCRDFRMHWKGNLTTDIQQISGLHTELAHAFYFITREALSNIEKHANATVVSVKLSEHAGRLSLEISDNGVGFDTTAPISGHFGQSIMRERAQMIEAEIEIYSQPGSGTKITLHRTINS